METEKNKHIKGLLPVKENTPEGIIENFEGVWLLVDEKTEQAYNTDENGTQYKAILDNDSFYYPEITHGLEFTITMQGDTKPIISSEEVEAYINKFKG